MHATNIRDEIQDKNHEPRNVIKKDVYSKFKSYDLIKRLRHIVKKQVFDKWSDIDFIEEKNNFIINKLLSEWEKKRSSQRRDLNELFKFLKIQGLSANYKRVIEANRTSKYIDRSEIEFMYSHPSISMSDSMKYALKRNEFYFYKNFEMLSILSGSYESNADIKNAEISNMRNLTASLYYKLLSYSKTLTQIISCLKTNTVSQPNQRHKYSLLVDELTNNPSEISLSILEFSKTKVILKNLSKLLLRIQVMLGVNLNREIDYYEQIQGCLLTQAKCVSIQNSIESIISKILEDMPYMVKEYPEALIHDFINELNTGMLRLCLILNYRNS